MITNGLPACAACDYSGSPCLIERPTGEESTFSLTGWFRGGFFLSGMNEWMNDIWWKNTQCTVSGIQTQKRNFRKTEKWKNNSTGFWYQSHLILLLCSSLPQSLRESTSVHEASSNPFCFLWLFLFGLYTYDSSLYTLLVIQIKTENIYPQKAIKLN